MKSTSRMELRTMMPARAIIPIIDVAVKKAPVIACPDRKSTRLNSSHANISYAVFCLKKEPTAERYRSATVDPSRRRRQRQRHGHHHPAGAHDLSPHPRSRGDDRKHRHLVFFKIIPEPQLLLFSPPRRPEE